MARRRYSVGDKVLASRAETGEDHEPGNVVDSYELIIGEERRPVVVVEFEDGERKYMTAATPNVLPVYEEKEEESEAAEAEEGGDEEAVEADGPTGEPETEAEEPGEAADVEDEEEGASP